MIDYIALYFGISLLLGIIALSLMAALAKKTPPDKEEDWIESEFRALEIMDASRPMPLYGDGEVAAETVRRIARHVRAGAAK